MLASSLEFRTNEIERLIAANELNTATKRVMDFVSEFAANRKRKQEAIDIRASYNALREESRRYGRTDLENQELSKLRYRILDFIEIIKDEDVIPQMPDVDVETSEQKIQSLASDHSKTDKISKTKFEQEKEVFLLKRRYATAQASSSNVVFHGRDMKKKYGSKSIDFLFELSELELKLGEITSVVGENGNGKTTLLRIIAGQLQLSEGTLEYPNLASGQYGSLYSIKQKIAFIPQELPRWSGLLADNLHFSAAIHGIKGEQNEDEVAFIMSRLGLDHYRSARWSEISGGYRTRFALAKALVWNPRLIILDEPLANLDINAQQLFLQDLRYLTDSIANPKSIIISSQHLYSMEDITDNIIFIANGRAIYNGKLQDFGNDREDNSYEFACKLPKESLIDILDEVAWNRIEETRNYFTIATATSVRAKDLIALFAKHNVEITYFRDISKSTRRLFKLEK
jgi:ABC-2 type transport system ATP-binding protein